MYTNKKGLDCLINVIKDFGDCWEISKTKETLLQFSKKVNAQLDRYTPICIIPKECYSQLYKTGFISQAVFEEKQKFYIELLTDLYLNDTEDLLKPELQIPKKSSISQLYHKVLSIKKITKNILKEEVQSTLDELFLHTSEAVGKRKGLFKKNDAQKVIPLVLEYYLFHRHEINGGDKNEKTVLEEAKEAKNFFYSYILPKL